MQRIEYLYELNVVKKYMVTLLFYMSISIGFSFLCSILEAVLLSVSPTFINVNKQAGNAFAFKLEELKKDVDAPLIAILTLNTLAHTVGAILVGSQAAVAFGAGTFTIPFTGINLSAVFLVSTIMTFLVLVASEIIPKTIGATYWKQLAQVTTSILGVMVLILKYTGILWFLQFFTKFFGGKGHGSVLSKQDLSVMSDVGAEQGIIDESEKNIIKNVLDLHKIHAEDAMTPRKVVIAALEEMTVREFYDKYDQLRFSRIPIYHERIDNITGYVLKSDILLAMINQQHEYPLSRIKRKLLFVNQETNLDDLFETLSRRREHIAGVTDEFGGFAGVVSMEDIFEEMLGQEIMDEMDNVQDMRDLASKNWEEEKKNKDIEVLEQTENSSDHATE